jgi:hypothetical protein
MMFDAAAGIPASLAHLPENVEDRQHGLPRRAL